MVYLQKGTKTYKLRVVAPDGRSAILSTECKVDAKGDADQIEAAYKTWRGDRGGKFAKPELLVALVEKRITLREAWEASMEGTLPLVLAAAPAAEPPKPKSLVALVTEWHDWKAVQKKGSKSAPDYLRQLRTLYPEIAAKTFSVRHFTVIELAARLDALTVDSPTKNRYKLAASGFAKFLVRRGIIETNFTRDIEGFGENDARMVYYERPEAQRLIAGMPQPFAGAAAFAAGFCMEWGALAALMARDVDLTKDAEKVYVRGTKTKKRLRSVPLVEENRWVLPYLRVAVAEKAPNAKVFLALKKAKLLREQRKVANALKVVAVGEEQYGQHSTHDWRHTHAVQLLRDGYDEQIAADHLGHGNTNMVRKVYGPFISTAADYRRKRIVVEPAAADPATTSTNTSLKAVK